MTTLSSRRSQRLLNKQPAINAHCRHTDPSSLRNQENIYRPALKNSITNEYTPLSVVPFKLVDYPDAQWCCICPSGPPKHRASIPIIECGSCEKIWGHIECHGLSHLNKKQMASYEHCCFHCSEETSIPPTTSTTSNVPPLHPLYPLYQ